ncbi:hypothetical protein HHK36_001528 [Tetracentron sinense]|uniref:SAM-dependent MTase RsmB/NOP-type domain-containing protein n=1 Tax=Tetracentron sinense TaxID=13715 RepID=A0A835DV46_TETSI|nr:hypothetical protein HHK36_001528 [Tetracentron sinense]
MHEHQSPNDGLEENCLNFVLPIPYSLLINDLFGFVCSNSVQLQLLSNGFSLLKVGGLLVYSTCSLTVAQNEDVVEQFLLENPSAGKILNVSSFDIFCSISCCLRFLLPISSSTSTVGLSPRTQEHSPKSMESKPKVVGLNSCPLDQLIGPKARPADGPSKAQVRGHIPIHHYEVWRCTITLFDLAELQEIDGSKNWPCRAGRIPKTLRFDPLTSQTSGLFVAKFTKSATQ